MKPQTCLESFKQTGCGELRIQAAARYFRLIINLNWNVSMVPERIIVMGDEAFVLTRGEWGVEGDEPARL